MATSSQTPFGSQNPPTVNLLDPRSIVSNEIVEACVELGFFKVINHGISYEIIEKVKKEGFNFFGKKMSEKTLAGQASSTNPLGYGYKNIGSRGDMGELEYLLLSAHPSYIAEKSITISNDSSQFSSAINEYIKAVNALACKLLVLIAEGLNIQDTSVFSRLIMDEDSDSLIRFNYYSPTSNNAEIGFGEHTDPQLLSLLTSNDVDGFQISVQNDEWIPVPADPNALWVNVGDMLQVLTNGRFSSVRHRALTNSSKPRLSVIYFGAPSLLASISAPPEMLSNIGYSLYRTFTWAEFKDNFYRRRLTEGRLNYFKNE